MSTPFKFKHTEKLRGMNQTEIALYWATASWRVPEDVSSEVGLPEEDSRPIANEIKRVHKLYKEAFEPLFSSYSDIKRPLSRELGWIEFRTVNEAEFDAYKAWAECAKVGDRRQMQIVVGSGPGETIDTFECTRVE